MSFVFCEPCCPWGNHYHHVPCATVYAFSTQKIMSTKRLRWKCSDISFQRSYQKSSFSFLKPFVSRQKTLFAETCVLTLKTFSLSQSDSRSCDVAFTFYEIIVSIIAVCKRCGMMSHGSSEMTFTSYSTKSALSLRKTGETDGKLKVILAPYTTTVCVGGGVGFSHSAFILHYRENVEKREYTKWQLLLHNLYLIVCWMCYSRGQQKGAVT